MAKPRIHLDALIEVPYLNQHHFKGTKI